tara:strand:+ start:66 stop:356 length:291 start_codon:yes stop_codon:yes gene_type:complete
MEIIIVILSVIIIMLSFGIYNLILKYETLEDEVSQFDSFIELTYTSMRTAYYRMKNIDRVGSFESDDETGYIFKEIKATMELLNKQFNLDAKEEKE